MVVEDDALTRKLLSRMLTRLGHNVQTAENGRLGLDAILASDPDLVLLDNQMPVLCGPEVVAELRRLGRRTFVCGASGNAIASDQQDFLAAGLDALLTKPVLERSLRTILLQAKQRRKETKGL